MEVFGIVVVLYYIYDVSSHGVSVIYLPLGETYASRKWNEKLLLKPTKPKCFICLYLMHIYVVYMGNIGEL